VEDDDMKKWMILVMLALPSVGLWTPTSTGLVVHEWGTFTSVAGKDGAAVDWRPLLAPDDLPSFVYGSSGARGRQRELLYAKYSLRSLVRMETPVLYFYADEPTEVAAKVDFPKGRLTEWYPWAKEERRSLDWGRFTVEPKGQATLLKESKPSHYYPARETDAALLRVGEETEKLLFYRGVGAVPVPVKVTMDASRVTVTNVGPDALARVFVVESRGGKVAYRTLKAFQGQVAIERSDLVDGLQELQRELVKTLVAQGLFEKEARAMVKTWEDSWFEDGVRVLYLVPSKRVDEALPLTLDPKPSELARVFVGRAELITPELERSVLAVMERTTMPPRVEDVPKIQAQLGRFGESALRGLAASTPDKALQTRINAFLSVLN
jgi:hypothetical protein